jgi:hypothetical protein
MLNFANFGPSELVGIPNTGEGQQINFELINQQITKWEITERNNKDDYTL